MNSLDPNITSIHGIPLPLNISLTQRQRLTDHEVTAKGQGVSAAFVNSLYSLTLYVYNSELLQIPDDVMSTLVIDHFKQTIQATLTSAHADNEKLECRAAYSAALRQGEEVRFLVAEFGFANDHDRFKSFTFLATKSQHFVKLRFSFYQTSVGAKRVASLVAKSYFTELWSDI